MTLPLPHLLRRPLWDSHFARIPCPTLEHSWPYGEAVAKCYGATVIRQALASETGEPLGLAQLLYKRGLTQVVRGPLWLPEKMPETLPTTPGTPHSAALRAFCRTLPWPQRQLLFWQPELSDSPAHHQLLRQAGLRRISSGYVTALLDLTPPLATLERALPASWRADVRKTQEMFPTVEILREFGQVRLFLLHTEKHRRTQRFAGPERRFVQQLFLSFGTEDFWLLALRHEGRLLAGIVLLCHGQSATYYLAWRDPVLGTAEPGLHKRLLWEGIIRLQARGIRWLDLGGLPPEAPGICAFKRRLGGQTLRLAGVYW
jgi:Acetyltransferase (GNAT) domain